MFRNTFGYLYWKVGGGCYWHLVERSQDAASSSVRYRTAPHNKELPGGFPGGAVVKNPPANAGDTGLSPGPGRSHVPRSN